jgi:hypothetical protein
VSFTGAKRPRRCVKNTHIFSTEAKEKVELNLFKKTRAFMAGHGMKFSLFLIYCKESNVL